MNVSVDMCLPFYWNIGDGTSSSFSHEVEIPLWGKTSDGKKQMLRLPKTVIEAIHHWEKA